MNVSLCRRIPGVVRIYFTALSYSDLARGKELVDVAKCKFHNKSIDRFLHGEACEDDYRMKFGVCCCVVCDEFISGRLQVKESSKWL